MVGRYGNLKPVECCKNCVFFAQNEGTQTREDPNGRCVRYPQQAVLDRFRYPPTHKHGWCGEWSNTEHRKMEPE